MDFFSICSDKGSMPCLPCTKFSSLGSLIGKGSCHCSMVSSTNLPELFHCTQRFIMLLPHSHVWPLRGPLARCFLGSSHTLPFALAAFSTWNILFLLLLLPAPLTSSFRYLREAFSSIENHNPLTPGVSSPLSDLFFWAILITICITYLFIVSSIRL